MKILLLSDSNSPHTLKWATALAEREIQVIVFSITENSTNNYKKYNNIVLETGGIGLGKVSPDTSFSKLTYLKFIPLVRNLVEKYKPDVLHAHYATSYGLLGAFSNFHPLITSVWGSDVLSFPLNSMLHKSILKFISKKSNKILATSNFLAKRTNDYTEKQIQVIPFGVDINKFKLFPVDNPFEENAIVVGTVKSLEKIYGIDTLIKSFNIVRKTNKHIPLKLLIVGSGSEEKKLKSLAAEMLSEKDYYFTGYIDPEKIPVYHNMMDISVYLSLQESFGVSVLEAMACCKPVIVSRVGGLVEILNEGKNGLVVSPKNPEEAAKAIEKLIMNPEMRIKYGLDGRERVKNQYEWNRCVDLMINVYSGSINKPTN